MEEEEAWASRGDRCWHCAVSSAGYQLQFINYPSSIDLRRPPDNRHPANHYCPPCSVHNPTSTVHCPPPTAHRLPCSTHRSPSTASSPRLTISVGPDHGWAGRSAGTTRSQPRPERPTLP